ncbi:lipid-A-disaccharide synthase [Devosia sp.]|uniref:lipid-A-disaccharide synthase n=1 Tax=Devosia sp. TaxID=1871048 RepID=UPI00326349FE
MAEPLKLFVVAGEPSGDRIGADLIAQLQRRVPLAFAGVGGDELVGQGLKSLFPMNDLAVMGITDVLMRLPLLLWRIEQTARAIAHAQPDIVVLIDAQDFSKRVAKRARRMGYRGAMLLYVAPTVWARRPDRAAKLKPLFDEVLAVLPFEPEAMQRLGGPPTCYVGHPALGEVSLPSAPVESGLIALLPGSRDGELRRHLPLMRELAAALISEPNVTGFFMPTLPGLSERLQRETASWPVPVQIAANRDDRKELYGQSLLAISVAGTATLELALAGVPTILTYVMDGPQARTFDKLGRPQVGLANIISGRQVVPEFVTATPDVAAVTAEAKSLVQNKQARQDQITAFGELVKVMQTGTADAPRQNPADRVLSHWRKA